MLFDDLALSALKKQFVKNKIKKEGIVKGTDRGFGFLESDRDSFFIAPDDMRRLTHGDRIQAYIEEDNQGRKRALPISLVDNFLKRFVARTILSQGRLLVIPDHPNIRIRINAKDVRKDQAKELKSSDWVVCNLTAHALKDGKFEAEICEYICSKEDPKAPWLVSLRRYDLPLKEPDDEKFDFQEKAFPRRDMRNLCFVTIDSAHTEDMDDALYIEKNDFGYKLMVAIADPTGYVADGSHIDKIASVRGFSIYLPGRDIPMLPRVMSDNLCSLRENEERPALVGSFQVNNDGSIDFSKTVFELATIKSHGKLIYNDVSDYLEGKDETSFKPNHEIDAVLRILTEFTASRDAYRSTHAATFRNKPDYDFILNSNGALDHIEINYRRIANQIVEESMITANIGAGYFLATNLHCGIFNSHAGFDMKKKEDLIELLNTEQCPFNEETLASIEGYNEIRRFALGTGSNYMDCRIRRLQEYSQITNQPLPHYALGVKYYATWTSPIRKYGDMINHRLIKSIIVGAAHPKLPDNETLLSMNLAKRTNRMAERDVKDWLYVDYLEPDIEKRTIFEGEVFDITRGGMRISLNANGAMVFVPFCFMSPDRDSLVLDGDRGIALKGNETVLKLGDTVNIKIIEVDKENRSVTGAPAESIGGVMLPDPYIKREEPRRNKRNNEGDKRDHSNRNNDRNPRFNSSFNHDRLGNKRPH